MNENLRRALLRARLTEDDVAVHLEVDPKTVRRWLEGRLPYLRHRWALASMLHVDEIDLWPQIRAARSWPEEVRAIYPHRDAVPREVWQDFFRSAEREIGILASCGLFLTEDPAILATLRDRSQAGVRMRICLRDQDSAGPSETVRRIRDALSLYGLLRESRDIEIRLHGLTLNNSIYHADDELLIGQRALGIPTRRVPILHLRRTASGAMVAMYLESFDRIWADALPLAEA